MFFPWVKVTPDQGTVNKGNNGRPGPQSEPAHQPIPMPRRADPGGSRSDAEMAASWERDGKARSWDDAAAITRACHLTLTALWRRYDCNGELALRLCRLSDELWRASASFHNRAREIRYPNGEARP